MAQWRKIVVSGSTAELNNISSSGDIVPVTSDGSSLGGATLQFSDLYLAEGAVINWDNGDMTITQTNNLLDIDSGNTRVDRLELDSAADYLDVAGGDLQVIAAADIILDPGGGEVDVDGNLIPNTDSADDLGASGKAWNKLWVDDIDLNAQGSISIGGTGRIDLDADDDTSIRASADDVITFEAAGADQVAIADGTLTPSTSDDISLGTTALQFSDLFLAEGGVINWDNGDETLTQTADQLALAGGYLTVAGSITGSHFSGSADSTGSFGYLNVSGDGVFGGNITFGDAATDSVSFGADIDSNLIPNIDDTYDLGSAAQAWQDLFLEGDITLTDAGTVKATAGNLTVDSEAATLVLDGHTGVDIDASNSGKVAIDGAGGIDIGVATDVAIDIDSSTLDIDASGAITIDSSAASISIGSNDIDQAINIGTQGERTITVGNVAGAAALAFNAGTGGIALASTSTGDITINSDDTLLLDSDGVLELNTSGGAINIGTDGVAVNTTIGNVTGTTALALNAGTGGIALASTGAGDITLTSTDTVLVDSAGVLELNSSAGAISIGNDDIDQAINIGTQGERTISVGTGAFADTINIGNSTGATAVTIAAGTGDLALTSTDNLTLTATDIVSMTDGTATFSLAGSGATALAAATTVDLDGTGAMSLNSSGGAIGVGNDAVGQKISVGGEIVTRTEVELNAILVDINAGTGGVTIDGGGAISLDSGAASNFTTTAGDITIDSEAGSVNVDGGESDVAAVRIVASHTAGGIDVDAGTNGINVDSTGAITIGGTNATGVTIGKADTTVTIPGDLDINGTMTTIDTVNLRVADRFVLVASGSVRNNALGDGGLIVNTTADGSGSALFYNDVGDRWALTGEGDTGETQQVAPAKQYVVSVSQSAAPPTGNPGDFGRDNASRRGIIYIQTSDDVATSTVDGDIWIWS